MFKKQAFTLAELMVVVLIMAVLMAVAVPMFLRAKARSEAKACRATLTLIDSAKKEWALDNPDDANNNSYNNPDGTGAIPTVADINPYIDGGFAGLQPCPDDNSGTPTSTTSYNINRIDLDPNCNMANMTTAGGSQPCSSGPDDALDSAANNYDDDHRLP